MSMPKYLQHLDSPDIPPLVLTLRECSPCICTEMQQKNGTETESDISVEIQHGINLINILNLFGFRYQNIKKKSTFSILYLIFRDLTVLIIKVREAKEGH